MYSFNSKPLICIFTFIFFKNILGRLPAAPPAAAADSAAGRAGPEKVVSRGLPEEKQQTTHPTTRQLPSAFTHLSYNQLQPDLRDRIWNVAVSFTAERLFSYRQQRHLEAKTEEGQEPERPGRSRGVRVRQRRLPCRVSRLKP